MRRIRITATRSFLFLAAVALASAVSLTPAPATAAPLGWQVSGGWYTEDDDFFLGGGARIALTTITVIPNFEWLFVDHGKIYTLNLDATLNAMPLGVATVYFGGGIGMMTVDPEFGSTNSDMTVNLIGGTGLNAVPLKPFAQLKYVIVDGDDPLVFSFGVRF